MSKKQQQQQQTLPPDYGALRASQFAEVFTAFPAYRDDSMFTMTRYHSKAQDIMSRRDHARFMEAIMGLTEIWAAGLKPHPNAAATQALGTTADKANSTTTSDKALNPSPNTSATVPVDDAVTEGDVSTTASSATCRNPPGETVAERARRTAALRRDAQDVVKNYPELAAGFDNFCMASRAAIRSIGGAPSKS